MNKFTRKVYSAIFFIGAISLCTAPAQATPFAGVTNASWSARFFFYSDGIGLPTQILPAGLSISCFGDAAALVPNGCRGLASLTLTNDSSADIVLSLLRIGGLSVTNNSGIDLAGFLNFKTDFSAFNPGGSQIGASVDDPLYEYAAFGSSVTGPGVGDFHGCNTLTGPNFVGPNACGVNSPDSSQGEFSLGPLAAGQTRSATYNINIRLEAIGVPEPATIALFGMGMAGAIVMCRRKKYVQAKPLGIAE
jgi:hypothetical protein